MKRLLPLSLLCWLAACPAFIYAQAGTLDSTFAGDGIATISFDQYYEIQDAKIQPDGKIVLVGKTISQSGNFLIGLRRLQPNGALDMTFGVNGKVQFQLTDTDFFALTSEAYEVELQPDGRIVVSGTTQLNTGFGFARLMPDGQFDLSLDSNGIQVRHVPFGLEFPSIALQPDGKIVAVGTSIYQGAADFGVLRFLPNGLPDNTFGGDGQVLTDFEGLEDAASDVAVLPDGKILVSGGTSDENGQSGRAALARYQADGSLDATFGNGGRVLIPLPTSADAPFPRKLTVLDDGRILIGGLTYNSSNFGSNLFLMRLQYDGTLDTGFADQGIKSFDISNGSEDLVGMEVQVDGKIVVAAQHFIGNQSKSSVTRFTPDGQTDPTFGDQGTVFSNFGFANLFISSMALQSDGKPVVFGTNALPSIAVGVVLRLKNDNISVGLPEPFHEGLAIRLYPNPAYDRVALDLPDQWPSKPIVAWLYDAQGRPVGARPITGNTIYIGDLAAGMYFLHVEVEGETMIGRLMKP